MENFTGTDIRYQNEQCPNNMIFVAPFAFRFLTASRLRVSPAKVFAQIPIFFAKELVKERQVYATN